MSGTFDYSDLDAAILQERALRYPDAPGSKVAAGPSQAAADAIAPKLGRLQRLVFDEVRKNGPGSADQIGQRCGLSPFSARPRCTELKRKGLLQDTGQRHRNPDSGIEMTVWGLSPAALSGRLSL